MDALQVLKPRFEKILLKGLQKGWFNEDNDKMFAYTVLSVKDDSFENLYRWHLSSKSHSHYLENEDDEKFKKYNSDGSYSYKGIEELVKENIFQHSVLEFYGVRHKDDWYIMYDCSYYEQNNVQTISDKIEERFRFHGFKIPVYELIPEFSEEIDIGALYEIVSQELGREVGLRDYEILFSHAEKWPREKISRRKERQPVEQREFVGEPWLVGHLKQEEKSKINRAFEVYINEAVFHPLVKRLRIHRPNDFVEVDGLYSEHYPLLYPHSKDYVLAIIKAHNENEKSRLYYFLYVSSTKQLFEWTKPPVHEVPGHHAEWILGDIKNLSVWGDEFSFHEPSVTMDDCNFWDEHVFKQSDCQYLFLQPIDIRLK